MTNGLSFTIAVASGKGGTGKTLIATNLHYVLNKKGYHNNLIDCDAEAPNAALFFEKEIIEIKEIVQKVPQIDTDKCIYCGKCQQYCNYNAIFILPPMKIIKVMDELCHSCNACMIACEFQAIRMRNKIVGKTTHYQTTMGTSLVEARTATGLYSPVPVIKDTLKNNKWQLAIIDAPPGTSCPFIHTVINADFVILVTEPTPFGLSDLKQSVQTLKDLQKKYAVIVNKQGIGNLDVYDYLKEEKIPVLLEIPFDKNIALAYSDGKLFVQQQPQWEEKFTEIFKNIIRYNGNSSN